MHPIIHQYQLRLTNLSQSNRSLKLGSLSVRKNLDLTEATFINRLSTPQILDKLVSGRSVDLMRSLSSRDEATNLLDIRINKLYREVNSIYEETGTDDLFLGYPFVEGKFLDGTVARCPVLLFPVKLVRNTQKSPRWKLEVPKGESISFNKTFFLAYEKFQQVKLPKAFWEEEVQHQNDLQELLNYLYAFFRKHELQVNFNSELFQFQVTRFRDKNKAELNQLELGKLKFYPHAVLGLFPQSDSALLQDYEVLEKEQEAFELKNFFEVGAPEKRLKYIPENQRYFVTPVDQSQEESLLAVKNGQSLVLHGPPGTGKSQVILNLIADALARGQKVLVCSQKRAALDVVYSRLSELGLGRFAGLIHDHRGDRSKIFKKISRQIEDIDAFKKEGIDLRLSKWQHDFRQDARKIDGYNQFFDTLFEALTKESRFGLSPHQLYLLCEADIPLLPLKELARQFDYQKLRRLLSHIQELLSYREFFQHKYPWKNRLSFHNYGFEMKAKLKQKLLNLPRSIEDLARSLREIPLTEPVPARPEQITEQVQVFQKLAQRLEKPKAKADHAAFHHQGLKQDYARKKLDALEKVFREMVAFKTLNKFKKTLFHDLQHHLNNYKAEKDKFGRLFSLSFLKARWYLQEVLKENNLKLTDATFLVLEKEYRLLDRLIKQTQSLSGQLFFEDLPLTDSPAKLMVWLKMKRGHLDLIQSWEDMAFLGELKPIQNPKNGEFDSVLWQHSLGVIDCLQAHAQMLKRQLADWNSWLHPTQIQLLTEHLKSEKQTSNLVKAWLESFCKDFEDLRSLDLFLQELSLSEKAVVQQLDAEIGNPKLTEQELLSQIQNSFLLSWIELLEIEIPELSEVSSRRMDQRVSDFGMKVTDRQEKVIQLITRLLKDEIINNIEYNRLKNPVTYRGIAHQVRKKRMLWSVRKLVRTYWQEGLNRLIPCWLASPESVSALFPMEKNYFDLVIFDEASQCYVERALPVMLRGRQCVITGDDKQLPPFDLYKVKIDEDAADLEAGGMALEVESVLDLSQNIFAESKLSWHYRSQEEELINFSNHAFYGGRLNIIPPAEEQEAPPIEFIKVLGQWEKSQNLVEAKRVITLVEKYVQDPGQPSIGIVTFNFQQKELIRDELERRMEDLSNEGNEALLALFYRAMEREEEEERQGIFIKNIENVQGDERDIIIFSVAYSYNHKGKLATRFGLLNQKGGENRLNVAITRARKKIIVVCSFDPVELEVEDSLNPGPKLFKKYLQYAKSISDNNLVQTERILNSLGSSQIDGHELKLLTEGESLVKKVAKGLEARGFKVALGIGDTNYQLDLAIIDPNGGFLLGIECEGKNYFSGKSSKEREVYRRQLLLKRGWKVSKVWARNYFLDPKKEISNLVEIAETELKRRSEKL